MSADYHHNLILKATPFRDFTEWCAQADNLRVDIQDARRRNLRAHIDAAFGGNVSLFAKMIGKSQSQLADTLDGRKPFGEKVARNIERSAGLVSLSLDSTGPARLVVRDTIATYGLQLTRAAALLGQEWDKLDPALQRAVQTMIEALVAKQKRAERRKHDQPDDPAPRPRL